MISMGGSLAVVILVVLLLGLNATPQQSAVPAQSVHEEEWGRHRTAGVLISV
jgi:hypothetical protein